MAEEKSRAYVMRNVPILRVLFVLLPISVLVCIILCSTHLSRTSLESPGCDQCDVAELQLNNTGPRQDPRLYWQAGPELGRSFMHGPKLDKGQLNIQRNGIYRLHIQVTLANCSIFQNTMLHRANLAVGICSPTTTVFLLRLNFYRHCTVTSQRLTRLAHGDTLCINLTLPLLPSQNADETFFGVQWVHP